MKTTQMTLLVYIGTSLTPHHHHLRSVQCPCARPLLIWLSQSLWTLSLSLSFWRTFSFSPEDEISSFCLYALGKNLSVKTYEKSLHNYVRMFSLITVDRQILQHFISTRQHNWLGSFCKKQLLAKYYHPRSVKWKPQGYLRNWKPCFYRFRYLS